MNQTLPISTRGSRIPLTTITLRTALIALAFGAAFAQPASAQTTWSTSPTSGTMNTAGNWAGGSVPADNTAWAFTNSGVTTLTNDFVSRTVAGIIFRTNADAFTLTGNAFTLTGGITNSSTALQTINNNLSIGSTVTLNNTLLGGITLGGVISGAGGITKTGAGTLTLSGNNTYNGGTTVSGGTLLASGLLGSGGTYNGNFSLGGGTLILSNSGAQTLGGTITGSGGTFINSGAGTTTLSAAQGHTGMTWSNAGTLIATNVIMTNSVFNNTGTYSNSGTFDMFAAGTNTINLLGGTATFNTMEMGNSTGVNRININDGATLSSGGNFRVGYVGGGTNIMVVSSNATFRKTGGTIFINQANSGAFAAVTNYGTFSNASAAITMNSQSGSSNTTRLVQAGGSFYSGGLLQIGGGNMNNDQLLSNSTTEVIVSGGTFTNAGAVTLGVQGFNLTNTFTIRDSGTATVGTLNLGSTNVLYQTGTNANNSGTLYTNTSFLTNIGGQTWAAYVQTTYTNTNAGGGGTVSSSYTNIMSNNNTVNLLTGGTLVVTNSISVGGVVVGTNSGAIQGTNPSGYYTFNWDGGTLKAGVSSATFFTNGPNLTATLGANGGIFDSAGFNTTIGANLGGQGAFTKTGAGTLTLSGTNTYAGNTTINQGELAIGGAGQLGNGNYAGNISIATNSTFNVASTANQTIGGVISGNGALTKSAAGTLTLAGSNNYTGATTISNGAVNIQNANALGTTDAGTTVISGAALQLQGGIAVGAEALTLNGTGVSSDGALRNISGSNSYAGAITLGAATRINSDAGLLTLSGGINGANNALTVGGAGNTTIGAAITNSTGALTKDGAGALTLSASNSYTGGTTIQGGTLVVGNAFALGSTNGTITFNTAPSTLQFASGIGQVTLNAANVLNVQTNASIINNSTLLLSNSSTTLSVANGQTLTLSGAGTTTFNMGGANPSVVSLGNSNSTLLITNTYVVLTNNTGGASFANGTVRIVNATLNGGANGNGIRSGNTGSQLVVDSGGVITNVKIKFYGNDTIVVTNGGVFYSSGGVETRQGANSRLLIGSTNGTTSIFNGGGSQDIGIASWDGNAAGTFTNNQVVVGAGGLMTNARNLYVGSGGNASFNQAVVTNGGQWFQTGTITIGNKLNDNSNSLTITGPGSLFSVGAGQSINIGVTNSGTNSGNFLQVLNGGVLTNAGTVTLDNSNSYALLGGGTLQANTVALNNATVSLILSNTGTTNGVLLARQSGNLITGTGTVNLAGNGEINTGANTVTNTVAMSGSGAFTKSGTGTLVLASASTYGGGTAINAGALQIGDANALGTTGTISYGGGTLLYGSGITTDLSGRFSSAASQAYAIDTGGNNVTYASALTSSGGSLAKSGSGTLTLTASNSYTGGTTISAGALQIGDANALGTTGTISFGGGTLLYGSGITTDLSGRFSSAASQAYAIDTGGNNVTYANALTSSGGSLAKSGSGTLTLTASNSYTGGTTISAGTLEFASSANQTLGGAISGSGALVKSAAGTLSLTVSNSYTGGTTLSGGTLQLGHANALGTSGTISFGGGTLLYGSGITTDLSSRFSGAANQAYAINTGGNNVTYASALTSSGGSLTKTGTGTLTLSASNSYTGKTTINSGAIAIGADNRLGTAPGTLVADQLTLDGGTLRITGYTTWSSTRGIYLGAGGGTIDTALNTLDANTGGLITGPGSLTKTGASQLNLNANTYQGGLILNQGTLYVRSSSTVSNGVVTAGVMGTGTFTINGGSLLGSGFAVDLSANGYVINNNFSVNPGVNAATNTGQRITFGVGAIDLTGGERTATLGTFTTPANISAANSALRLASPAITNGTFRFVSGGNSTQYSGLELNGARFNDGTGLTIGTNVITVMPGYNDALGNNATNLPRVTLEAGGYLNLSETATTASARNLQIRTLSGSNGSYVTSLASSGTSVLTINNLAGDSATFSGQIVDGSALTNTLSTTGTATVALTKSGEGTQILAGSNSYTGATTISGGTLALSGSGSLANSTTLAINSGTFDLGGRSQEVAGLTGAGSATNSSGTLTVNKASGSDNFSGTILGAGALAKSGNGTLTLSGNNSYTGATTISAGTLQIGNGGSSGSIASTSGVTNNATLAYNRSDSITAGYVISGSGNLVKLGAGTLVLSGNNSYRGGTTLNAGTLEVNSASSLGDTNGGLTFAGTSTLRATASFDTVRNYNINANATIDTAGNNLTNRGVLSGSSSLTKTGLGTFRIDGSSNTFSGTTAINQGALIVDGNLGGTTTVGSGATLGGSGTLANVTVSSGGILSPGNSPGLLTVTNTLALNGGGILNWELSNYDTAAGRGIGWDAINAGTLTLNNLSSSNPFTINITGSSSTDFTWGTPIYSFAFITQTNGPISDFDASWFALNLDSFTAPTGADNYYWTITKGTDQFNNSLYLNYVVPEPSTYAMLILSGVAMAGYAIRRRTRRNER